MFLPEDDLVERPEEPITTPKPQSNINIPINYTIEDGAIIIHEFFHFLNETEEFSGIRDIFTEMISIYFETWVIFIKGGKTLKGSPCTQCFANNLIIFFFPQGISQEMCCLFPCSLHSPL